MDDKAYVTGNGRSSVGYVIVFDRDNGWVNVLHGLQILKCDINETSRLTTHPIENGQYIADNKVRDRNVITIHAMCDNHRERIVYNDQHELDYFSSNNSSTIKKISGMFQDSVDRVFNGREFKAEQEISSFAMEVYAKIERMYTERDFKVYSIATKGAVYNNMMLTSINQLNDDEHLLTIPVVLKFEECMLPNENSVDVMDESDTKIFMGGYHKDLSLIDEAKNAIIGAISGEL